MPKLDVFVPPKPWPAFSLSMSWVNRILMLHGLPLLRDVPVLNAVPGIRGLTGIRHIVTDEADIERLRALVAAGSPTFMLPNHPEFFTDWMLDKDIIARAAPEAASWATHGVVNGMGSAMQKFWLWNNLIAQIPGGSTASKDYSVEWASKGKGVLLHPEGMVGWHPDWIAPLMPGAADMARDSAKKLGKSAYLQPIVWKIVFKGDVSAKLAREVAYVEKRLKQKPRDNLSPAQRTYAIYTELADHEIEAQGLRVADGVRLSEKLETVRTVLSLKLTEWMGEPTVAGDAAALVSRVRKQGRVLKAAGKDASGAMALADRLQLFGRLGGFAFSKPFITQEEVAAHIKRLRNDWCKGTFRDSLNAFLPQPAGMREAHIRFLEPVEANATNQANEVMNSVRHAMQSALDRLNEDLAVKTSPYAQVNPFFEG